MPYVISTMSTDVQYNEYVKPDPTEGGKRTTRPRLTTRSVLIKGGAGVPQKSLIALGENSTVNGVRTEISKEEAAMLLDNRVFQIHLKAGEVRIVESKVDPEKAAKDMKPDTSSTPLTEKDSEPGGRIAGVASSEKTEKKGGKSAYK